ncbi:hypothetical protein HSX10_14570 [Winogradskyella undariae]|uniref:hypothetical protein n=1 Tax=Winogradskyella undariae TaxID=1285465 RepID=UPI00156B75E2|nr:hypothetical protein [Winogradskyella undariae]NRR92795.1 hypothetical protein [Winogradskyella undariae]
MAEVNYIKHLNAVFSQFSKDTRLNPTHISLYLAFFQVWNYNRFRNSFHVNRDDIMKLSKIGSKSTYHRCTKELHHYKYLVYEPSHNPFKGSVIKMLIFSSRESENLKKQGQSHLESTIPNGRQVVEQALDLAVPNQGQALVPSNKHIQTIENSYKLPQPKNENEVLEFFKKEKWPEIEAQKFYNHYCAIGWKIGGKIKMEDWHASAKNWMLKSEELSVRAGHIERSRDTRTNDKRQSQIKDNLHTIRNKDYNQPL